ncbi:hypothetical protein TNCV_4864571 [Trichonephila clavipes]|nr:hypothetical protein TNCV_4864571 [Trichonephila clavipes]
MTGLGTPSSSSTIDLIMIALSRVARGSFLIDRCVNVVTSVRVMVPSPCTGSEASSVRTGQWSSPIGSWVFGCEFLCS